MKYFISFLFLFLFSCVEQYPQVPNYPGHQFGYQECHRIWDEGFGINVKKCEHDTEYPKFILGQKVKYIRYDRSCNTIIIGNKRWAPFQDELIYTIKVYCNNKPMHDNWCEQGNILNCPEVLEHELYTKCRGKTCPYTQ